MANRLSLQSATCNAFQLQLCRQPYNSGTKTVSFLWLWLWCDAMRCDVYTVLLYDCAGLFAAVEEDSVQTRSMCVCGPGFRSGGVVLTVPRWCSHVPAACTAPPPPPRCSPARRRTDPGSGPGWWPVCPPLEVLPLDSPTSGAGESHDRVVCVCRDRRIKTYYCCPPTYSKSRSTSNIVVQNDFSMSSTDFFK